MLDCLIIGDSIGVGVANIRKECVAYVKGGINSYQWLNKNIHHWQMLYRLPHHLA
jgi:hypothetical protein